MNEAKNIKSDNKLNSSDQKSSGIKTAKFKSMNEYRMDSQR